ncbi:hypothetical protein HK102_001682 [Quaeritorhiza haematococci]|nr:hypothetical protein HK102_001682 [Quaeritorhiza haematococci]
MATSEQPAILFDMIRQGEPIGRYMRQQGFQEINDRDDTEAELLLNLVENAPFLMKTQGQSTQHPYYARHQQRMPPGMQYRMQQQQRSSPGGYVSDSGYDRRYTMVESDDSGESDEGEYQTMTRYDQAGRPRGKVLHFIPSEQIKLLKGSLQTPYLGSVVFSMI